MSVCSRFLLPFLPSLSALSLSALSVSLSLAVLPFSFCLFSAFQSNCISLSDLVVYCLYLFLEYVSSTFLRIATMLPLSRSSRPAGLRRSRPYFSTPAHARRKPRSGEPETSNSSGRNLRTRRDESQQGRDSHQEAVGSFDEACKDEGKIYDI